MYLKAITKNGVTRLYFYESYYQDGHVKQHCLESLGRLDVLQQQFPDPIAHFKEVAVTRTAEKKASSQISVPIDLSATMSPSEDSLKNVGYGILKDLYKQLELDKFWKNILKKGSIDYDLEAAFRLLVLSRILYPASKLGTFQAKNVYFEDIPGLNLKHIYRALDLFAQYNEQLQQWIYEHSEKIAARDLSVSYFDCTNYYFDIASPDLDILDEDGNPVDENGMPTEAKFRKRGPEKNHRPDPIVEMGLLTDKNGIPIAFDLFPGNESEKLHMRPIIHRVKEQFHSGRIILVADRGLNTSDNIYYLNGDNREDSNPQDGYVYGQSVRSGDEEFKRWVLSGDYRVETRTDENGNEVTFIHKSRIHPKTLHVQVSVPGQKRKKKISVLVDQKQMAYYSEKYAQKQKRDRDRMVARAKDLIAHPQKYDRITAAGSGSYVKNITFNKETGAVEQGRELLLNEDKIAEEEKYDGYYSIVTSELEMSDYQLRDVYGGLSRIEDTFKVSKSDFCTRPIFVWTNSHIKGHFVTCFTALVMIRLLEARLGRQFPVGEILSSLRKYNCVQIDKNLYQFVYYDKILDECSKVFQLPLNRKYCTREQIRRLLKY